MIDFKHENYWEYWIYNSFDFADLYVTPFNTIWMTFFFLGIYSNLTLKRKTLLTFPQMKSEKLLKNYSNKPIQPFPT
jgi:hypothetical protein